VPKVTGAGKIVWHFSGDAALFATARIVEKSCDRHHILRTAQLQYDPRIDDRVREWLPGEPS